MGAASRRARARKDEAGQPEKRRDLMWLAVIWGRVLIGLALAATAGVSFGHAWTEERNSLWWVGAVTLLAGVLLMLSALYARSEAKEIATSLAEASESVRPRERLVPLLGALLVYKYQLITHQQLAAAIEEQRKDKRLLGQILRAQGLITEGQLQEALAYQRGFVPEQIKTPAT